MNLCVDSCYLSNVRENTKENYPFHIVQGLISIAFLKVAMP